MRKKFVQSPMRSTEYDGITSVIRTFPHSKKNFTICPPIVKTNMVSYRYELSWSLIMTIGHHYLSLYLIIYLRKLVIWANMWNVRNDRIEFRTITGYHGRTASLGLRWITSAWFPTRNPFERICWSKNALDSSETYFGLVARNMHFSKIFN